MNGNTQLSNHDIICSHLYHTCFSQGLYADLVLRVNRPQAESSVFKLHRILVMRSPYIAAILKDLELSGNDRLVTVSGRTTEAVDSGCRSKSTSL